MGGMGNNKQAPPTRVVDKVIGGQVVGETPSIRIVVG